MVHAQQSALACSHVSSAYVFQVLDASGKFGGRKKAFQWHVASRVLSKHPNTITSIY